MLAVAAGAQLVKLVTGRQTDWAVGAGSSMTSSASFQMGVGVGGVVAPGAAGAVKAGRVAQVPWTVSRTE